MFKNVDGRTMDAGRQFIGILIAHLGAFGSGELKRDIILFLISIHGKNRVYLLFV